jgi:hypothetical protein
MASLRELCTKMVEKVSGIHKSCKGKGSRAALASDI